MREVCTVAIGSIGGAFGYAYSGVEGAIAGFLFYALFGVFVVCMFITPSGEDW